MALDPAHPDNFREAFNGNAAPIHSITELEASSCPQQTPAPAQFAAGEKADVVIVGGGYTGLSAALHLAQMARDKGQPISIVLLEAGKVGSAASGKNGGHVGPGFQESDEAAVLKMFATPDDGRKALALVNGGPALVEQIIRSQNIDCDLRRGYVILSGKQQVPVMDGSLFGIEPYPYLLGLAKAARDLGVRIYEDTPVRDITDSGNGIEVQTARGNIGTKEMLCAGGHRMAEVVPFLKPLRRRTLELLATMIVTDPLPPDVIKAIMPAAQGLRLPFSTDELDVAYGTIDRQGRIIFGAKVGALKTDPGKIAKKLFRLLPNLKDSFKQATGKPLGYRPLVANEPLCLTIDMLPNAGRMGTDGHVRYVHGLGGHGVALGTLLGKVTAEDIYGSLTKTPALQENFSLFSAVKHMRFPAWKPLRRGVAFAASKVMLAGEGIKQLLRKPWGGKQPSP
ncbi:MAG: FAD-binding oxidoreductase [Alphaproteobacteria bacterium]|nr:FAD-binding oxidoreductase [Alphaproteobacteria bacterium]